MSTNVTIYLRLVDEAVDVWAPAVAEALGGDRYRIVELPEDETTEFAVGDIVLGRRERRDIGEIVIAERL